MGSTATATTGAVALAKKDMGRMRGVEDSVAYLRIWPPRPPMPHTQPAHTCDTGRGLWRVVMGVGAAGDAAAVVVVIVMLSSLLL